ncbi:MAG: tetratricopeptide repeat protein [Bacteroidales bacterium]|nr:tetratricopeptide repeat protein [Bacteroidales bacterium]
MKKNLKKKLLFYLILLAIPFFTLLIIEIALRIFCVGYDLSLFRQSSLNAEYLEINPNVTRRFFFFSPGTEPYPEMFLKSKPDTCFRIFVLGESSAQGFPYRRNGSFPCMLQYLLQKTYPRKRIEVINVSMAAISSYALADFTNEILAQKPDLIIIYAGHNEYYGSLGIASAELGNIPHFIKKVHLQLVRLRLYQLLQNTVRKLYLFSAPSEGTLMNRIATKSPIEFRSKEYYQGIYQFETNMQYLLNKTKKHRIQVILSTLVSNIKDQPPLGKGSTSTWARQLYDSARSLEQKNEYLLAKKLYLFAKDLDDIRFRAPEDINNSIIKLAANTQYPILDIKNIFESHSTHGITGDSLIIDHLHPNLFGYKLMAYAFYQAILPIINHETGLHRAIVPFEEFDKNYTLSQFDQSFAQLSVNILKSDWPFADVGKSHFLKNFKPKNYLDSLLLRTIRNILPVEQSQFQFVNYLILNGNLTGAAEEYKALILKFPYHSAFYRYLADLYAKQGRFYEALITLQTFPDAGKNADILEQMIEILIQIKDFTRAKAYLKLLEKLKLSKSMETKIDALRQAIYNPNKGTHQWKSIMVDPEAKKYLEEASKLIAHDRYEEAIQMLKRSLQIQNTYIAHFFIGSIYLKKGDVTKAAVELEIAYHSEKNDPQLLHNLIVAYIKLGRYAEANQLLVQYKSLQSSDALKAERLEHLLRSHVK